MNWAACTIALVALTTSWAGLASAAPTNDDCLACHHDAAIAANAPKGKNDGQPVDLKACAASAHAKVGCTECHEDARADTHVGGLAKVDCGRCHAKERARFEGSAHGAANAHVTCTDCHGTHDTLGPKDARSSVSPARQPETCARCHDGKKVTPRALKGTRRFDLAEYRQSAHFRGVAKDGLTESATCSSCHGSHDMRGATDPSSRVYRDNVPKTCGRCHEGMLEQYETSVHGKALAEGSSETPTCIDCHGEHGIRAKKDPKSAVYATAISKTTCPQCHSAEHVNRRYGLATMTEESYRETYHGLADEFGDATVANCASCHGAHAILRSSDPKSAVNPANLAKTCGKCHPGAGPNFAKGSVHGPAKAAAGGAVLRVVKTIYLALIGGTIAGMAAYNGLDYFTTLRENWRRRKREHRVLRFTVGERIQHVLLVVSFFVLVITGFSLKYPDAFWVRALVDLKLSFLARGYAHRVAAAVNVALSLYHLVYVVVTARGRAQFKALMPTKQDARDLLDQMKYYLGLAKKPARFGRFSYVEKVEYLALIWGTIVMVVTGSILWFEVAAMRVLPMWGWNVAELVHLYEAWLATLSILVWHFYHVAFKPSGHGVSLAMVHGELTEEEMRHEHPAELEKTGLASTPSAPIAPIAPITPIADVEPH